MTTYNIHAIYNGLAGKKEMSLPFKPIEIHDLTVSYQQKPVLYGVDLEVEEGSLVGIIGPNGAGKSTLIKTMMDMIQPSGGFVPNLRR